MASTFRDNQLEDPRLDPDKNTSRLLLKQYEGYKKEDPPEKRQKAIPFTVIRKVNENRSSPLSIAIGQLVIAAIFFAMRSCEYLNVGKNEVRKTKRLRLRNLRLFRAGRLLEFQDPTLRSADFVSMTFEDQKNGKRHDTITLQNSCDGILNPVLAIADLIQRVIKIPGASLDSYINKYASRGKTREVTAFQVRESLRVACITIGLSKLGFTEDEIGTHSLRSGAAMAMYLARVPVYTIMLLGRWSSDAFLLYIRKQVEQFSHNVSVRMIENQHFTHVPNFEPSTSRLDPRQRNHRDNLQTRQNLGRGSGGSRNKLPSFALFT